MAMALCPANAWIVFRGTTAIPVFENPFLNSFFLQNGAAECCYDCSIELLIRLFVKCDHASPSELIWTRSEKRIARKAFDAALKRELDAVMQEAKQVAGHIREPSELWDLEHHLTQRRKEINYKYDFRGSRLAHVLGRLLYEGRLGEEQLLGLGEDKLKAIRSYAEFLAKMDTTESGT